MSEIADRAIDWFRENARDLPWRAPGTSPWGILVSEVMLQQTPVSRVSPVWEAWMLRWPTPATLATAKAADAIRMWGRLGYPRRALRLHTCAVALVEHHDGAVPSGVADLLALPGIGTYTAHAVAAFAFGARVPVVDTNVRRFAARAAAGTADAGAVTTAADLRFVESLLPIEPSRAAVASAAFMELGAVLCTARAPRCGHCPEAGTCEWRAAGSPAPDGPSRRPQTYAGTERQIRGRLLAVLRDADGPLPRVAFEMAWHEPERRDKALDSLLADGLVTSPRPGEYALAGD